MKDIIEKQEEILMKKLFYYADRFLEKSTWRDIAVLKFCLLSLGILAGMQIPKKNKKEAGLLAFFIFAVTYIPLMKKLIGVVAEKEQ
jgi:hypothetical protein